MADEPLELFAEEFAEDPLRLEAEELPPGLAALSSWGCGTLSSGGSLSCV